MSASSKKKLHKEIRKAKMTERQKQEKAEARKVKWLTISFVAVIVLVLGLFIGGRAVDHYTRYGVAEKNTIAATIGSHKINSVTMNYFFRDAVDSQYNMYYQYFGDSAADYLGFDVTQPLNKQIADETTGETWGDHFLESAIQNAHEIYTLYDAAKAAGFTMTEDSKASIESTMSTLSMYASISSLSTDQYLRQMYGNGSDAKSYKEYLTVQATASDYYNYYSDSLVYEDAAIREYDTAHPGEYDSYSYHSYTLSNDSFLALVANDQTDTATDPEASEPEATEGEPEATEVEATEAEPEATEADNAEDEEITYTEEQKQAARDAAKAAAESLKTATTVEELDSAIAALEINKDATTAPKSSASTNVQYANLSATFKDWLVSADRTAGNIEVFENKTSSTDENNNTVETITGYTVVMFDGRDSNETKMANIRQVLIAYEGGTTDDSGSTTYSDEEKAATHTKAEELLQAWKDGGASQEAFITLVNENNSSATDGGLVENINTSSSGDYKTWAMDESRKAGDTTIIDSSSGCYIVYYEGDAQLNYRDYKISQAKHDEDLTAWYEGIIDAVTPVKGNTSKVKTGLVYMPAST